MTKRKTKPFPVVSFEDALEVGNAIQKYASGEKVRRITLFDHLGKSPDSGPSRQLITNSNKYKITTGGYQAEFLELTEKGRIATSEEVSERDKIAAQIELAITNIHPFNFLYEKFNGNRLPSKQVLIDTLKETDITDQEVAEECVDLFIVNINHLDLLKVVSGSERIISIEHRLEETNADDGIGSSYSDEDKKSSSLVATEIGKNFDSACFYITPIGDENSEQRKHSDLFFGSIIEPVVEKFNLQLVRSDKISKPGLINTQIIEYLLKSKLVIADLSFHNPNVFYELAIRHMCRRPIVQIKRNIDRIPFDIQQVRTISIDTTDIYSLVPKLETYKSEISSQIRSALENPEVVDNPLTQHKNLLASIIKN